MNRKELVGAVATHTGMEPREVDKALKGMTEVIEAVAAKGEQVTIGGFAKFVRVDRPSRMVSNPATGAPVKVKASKKAKITPLMGFKDAVSAAPKLAKGVWPPAAKAPAKAAPARKAPAAAASKTAATKAPAATSPTKRPATNIAKASKTAAAAKAAIKKR